MARTTIRTEDITASEVTTAKMATDPTNATNLASGTVPTARLGSGSASSSTFLTGAQTYAAVDTSGINANADDIALLGFKVAANGSLAKYNLVDQTVDDFQDTSGVDASASTNEARDASGKYYSGSGSVTPSITQDADSTGTDGDYSWYKWTATGGGSYETDTAQDHEYLVIAGGGGGGEGYYGGAAGAGGYRNSKSGETTGGGGSAESALSLSASVSYTITVGAGGAGSTTQPDPGASGSNSVFATITASGGGGGGSRGDYNSATDGGSGGGNAGGVSTGGQAVSPTQGYDGGDCTGVQYGAGGGGAGAVGSDGTAAPGAGSGGAGLSSSIDGGATTRAGGGGGGGNTTSGTGGSGGGGAGGKLTPLVAPTAGTANTGSGGGGGGGNAADGAAGGSGIVIVRRITGPVTVYLDMTLVSNSTTAETEATKGDLVLTYTNGAGTATVNTDIKGWISRDNGTTYTQATLASQGTTGGHSILTAHDLSISGQPSGTSMRYKITTHNQSVSKQTRVQAVSLGWS